MKNSASTFRALTHGIELRDPQVPLDAKTQVQCNMSHDFYENRTGPALA
jgi:hypothetical protein